MPQGPAPDQNALTLLEWQKFANSPLYNAIVMSLYDKGSVLTDIPWKTDPTMMKVGARYTGANMSRVDFRKVNDLPIGTKAVPEKFQETAYIIRNDIITDIYIDGDKNNLTDIKAFQIDAFLESLKFKLNDYFINNTHDGLSDHDDAPVGIDARIKNNGLSAGAGGFGVQSGLYIDAGGVDISLGNINQQNANRLLVMLDRLLSSMGSSDGAGIYLYMNEITLRLVASAIRNLPGGAGFSTTTDNYDREVMKYKKAVLKDIGRKDDQITYIVNPYQTNKGVPSTAAGVPTAATPGTYGTEAPAGSNFTTIYAVRYGEMYFGGWQFKPLKAQDFGLVTPPGTSHEVLFDWAFGYFMNNSRSLAALFDVKIGQ